MTDAEWGWIGGIAGGVIGTLGGVIGSWASIRNARPGRARRFVIWSVAVMWLVLAAVSTLIILAIAGVLPKWVLWTTQMVFFVALGPAIVLGNRHLSRLDRDEAGEGP